MFKTKVFLNIILCLSALSLGTLSCQKTLKLEYAKNKSSPWELTPQFLKNLKEIFNSNTFIETGTWLGYTARHAAKIFDQVKTVELSKEVYERAKVELSSEKNITCYWGDSTNQLGDMIKAATGNLLFWLDGHYSGGPTALGSVTSPIIEELKIIKASGIKNSVILIDDIFLFDKASNKSERKDVSGYPLLEEVYPLIVDINPNYEILILGNILLAFEKNKSIQVSNVLKAYSLLWFNLGAPLKELIDAERSVSKANGVELETIISLYNHFCTNEAHGSLYEAHGIGNRFALCYILTLLNDSKKDKALEMLKGPLNLAIDKKYIDALIDRINKNQI